MTDIPTSDNIVLEALFSRRSIRSYTDEPVTREELAQILEAGRWAPSGLNNQPWRFLVLGPDDPRKQALQAHTKYARVVRGCQALVLVFLERERMYHEMKDHQSVGACLQNMLLAAHALGLGSVWLGEIINQTPAVMDTLGLGADKYEFQAALALGRPDQKGDSSRLPLNELMIEDI